MQLEQAVIDDIIRMHSQNEWMVSVIAKVVRRRYDIEIDIKTIRDITKKYDSAHDISVPKDDSLYK